MMCKLIDKKYISDIQVAGLENSTVMINVVENSQFIIDINSLIELPRISIDFVFNVEGVSAHVIGIYSISDSSKLTTILRAVHNVPNTSCVIDVRGALYDSSFSNHLGEIYIDKKASNTESYLNDHTLLLGSNSKTISMPNLRIHNNNVRASHGASIGPVSSEKIYYLQSRGFSKKDATDILVSGFFESTFNDITDQNMANTFRQKLLTFSPKNL